MSSSEVLVCSGTTFPGTESLSIAATVFPLLSLYTVYDAISAILDNVSLLFIISTTALLSNLNCTYI